jgi:hypothetical protein
MSFEQDKLKIMMPQITNSLLIFFIIFLGSTNLPFFCINNKYMPD